MARVHSTGLNRGGLGYLGDARPSVTGIDAVDKFLFDVEGQLETFKLAMTVTTISSLAAAIAGVILIIDRGARRR